MNLQITSHTCPTVSVLYPGLRRITLFVAFEEADAQSEPNYQQIIFTADNEAAFRLDCSRDACRCGGFDFAPIINALIGSEESRVHGRLACEGTLDGAEPCSLQAEYRIFIE